MALFLICLLGCPLQNETNRGGEMNQFPKGLALAVLASISAIANADTINNASTGLTAPGQVIDFGANRYDDLTPITDQFQDSGALFFSDGDPWAYDPNGPAEQGIVEGHLVRGGVDGLSTVFGVQFSRSVSEAAFNFRAGPGTEWRLAALRNGVEVESFTFYADPNPATTLRFYGFENSDFDAITLNRTSRSTDGFEFDNLQFSLIYAEQISTLVDTVISMNIQSGISNALDAKLDSTLRALEDANGNNDVAAVNAMYAFCSAVDAQRGQKITNDQADELIEAANRVIEALDESYPPCY